MVGEGMADENGIDCARWRRLYVSNLILFFGGILVRFDLEYLLQVADALYQARSPSTRLQAELSKVICLWRVCQPWIDELSKRDEVSNGFEVTRMNKSRKPTRANVRTWLSVGLR